MNDEEGWPPPLDEDNSDTFPGRVELLKQREAAKTDLEKQRQAAAQARTEAEVESELRLNEEFHKGILTVAQGSIDRARSGAETVQKAAAAIMALYTGVLGVTFSVADHPLPARGVAPAILLGFAVVFSTGYLAYLGATGSSTGAPAATSSLRAAELARDRAFINWTRQVVIHRAYWLRAGVLCLGFSVMFLPAPFVAIGQVKVAGHVLSGKTKTATSAATPDWPGTPTETDDGALQKIVYAAQVKEVATLRQEASKSSGTPGKAGDDGLWIVLAALALVASLVGAWAFGRDVDKPEATTTLDPPLPPTPAAASGSA